MSNEESEQTKLLREILKWIRFAGMKELKNNLESTLNTEQKKLVYHLSDGTHGIVEIASLAGIGSNSTIADMWEVWSKLGFGEKIPVKGGQRFKRAFELRDFGIEVPKTNAPKKEKKKRPQSTSSNKAKVSGQHMEATNA